MPATSGRVSAAESSSFDSDLRTFLHETELSARKVIKASDKKRLDSIAKDEAVRKKNAIAAKLTGTTRKVLGDLTTRPNTSSAAEFDQTLVPKFDETLIPFNDHVIRTAGRPVTSSGALMGKTTINLQHLPHQSDSAFESTAFTSSSSSSTTSLSDQRNRATFVPGQASSSSFPGGSATLPYNSVSVSTPQSSSRPYTTTQNVRPPAHLPTGSASTLRSTTSGASFERTAASTYLRSSNAFSASLNFEQTVGADPLRGVNAITRGLGGLSADLASADPATMSITYSGSAARPSTTHGLLDMGHFKSSQAPPSRVPNDQNGITTSSRAELMALRPSYQQAPQHGRPVTSDGGFSPARGSAMAGAAKIAMERMNSVLRDNSQKDERDTGTKHPAKLARALEKHVYNKSVKKGFVADSGLTRYKIPKDQEAWRSIDPASAKHPGLEVEVAGAISWNSDDIRIKWRGESEREAAWKLSRAAVMAAQEMQGGESTVGMKAVGGWVVAAPVMGRHPMHALYWKMLEAENQIASKRALMRSNTRRFNLDVHTVWLTNLSHLAEHSGLGETHKPRENKVALDGGRDVASIKVARSQIQSVGHERALQGHLSEASNNSRPRTDVRFTPPPHPPALMPERVVESGRLSVLINEERVQIPSVSGEIYMSVHRLVPKKREYYETAAILINGKWEIPANGGAEKLQPGLSVIASDDILKLNPKKWQAKEDAARFVSVESADDTPVDPLVGRTLETMSSCDSWVATNGKTFADLDMQPLWRVSLFDRTTGEMKTVTVEEKKILEVCTKSEAANSAKNALQYRAAPERPKRELVHRELSRVMCGEKQFVTLFSVSVTPGEGTDAAIYVDIAADVRIPPNFEEGRMNAINRFSKRITTYEAKERLVIGSIAPSRDLAWWTKKGQKALWQKLLSSLVLVPQANEAAVVAASPPKNKKKRAETKELLPVALEFPQSTDDQLMSAIGVAYELCSLVSLTLKTPGARGAAEEQDLIALGDKTAIKVEGINAVDCVEGGGGTPWGNNAEKDWEFGADAKLPMTLVVSGKDPYKSMIPGISPIGVLEPCPALIPPPCDKSRTQAGLSIIREKESSSSNSIQALFTLALETPTIAPYTLIWEKNDVPIPPSAHEIIECYISKNVSNPTSITNDQVDSCLNTDIAPVVYILSGSETPLDFGGLAEQSPQEKYETFRVVIGHNDLGFEIKEDRKKLRPQNMHRRRQTFFTKKGFRQNLMALREIIRPESLIQPAIFGITAKGAQPNVTGTTGRTIWHSEQRCVEQLCRQRTPFDYLYVLNSKKGSGYTDPRGFALLLSGYHLNQMIGIGQTVFDRVYGRINSKVVRKAKMQALQDKIRQVEDRLTKYKAQQEIEVIRASQKKLESKSKFGDGKVPEGLTREAWLERLNRSTFAEKKGLWERRILNDTDPPVTFYYRIVCGIEGGEIECSWDRPPAFDEWVEQQIVPGMLVGDGTPDLAKSSKELESEAEEKKVLRLAKLMAEDKGLIEALCNKLGVLIKRDKGDQLDMQLRMNVVRDRDMARVTGGLTELAEDEMAWSDSDDEAGMTEEGESNTADLLLAGNNTRPASDLPQHHGEVAEIRKRDRKQSEYEARQYHSGERSKRPDSVPVLNLNPRKDEGATLTDDVSDDELHAEKHIKGKGWRRLSQTRVQPNFWKKMTSATAIVSLQPKLVNSLTAFLKPKLVDPVQAVKNKVPNFDKDQKFESMFVRDVMADQMRIVEANQKRMERETLLLKSGGLEEIVLNQPNALTLADQMAIKEEQENDEDPDHLGAKASESARVGNQDKLEEILDLNVIDVDHKDQFGNSLLHLAAQQGNKKMVKFLLRRGASVTTQNLNGNTVLHHCHEYNHTELAEYLKSKGADDSVVNADGCTCYEGVSKDALANI